MYHLTAFKILLLFALFSQAAACAAAGGEIEMNGKLLEISVKCKDDPKCEFKDEDIFLEIFITNRSNGDIGYPLEFAKERGPSVTLRDTETKRESQLSTHLADWDLKTEFTVIKPGESVKIDWVVTEDELKQFGEKVDLTIEVSLSDEVRVNGKVVEFSGSGSTRIISKDKENDR